MSVMTTGTRTIAAPRTGFRGLLDERVLVAERRIDHVVGETELRRLEHLAGRDMSTHLMRRLATAGEAAPLGIDRPVDRGPHGEPVFPSGVVGSITHAAGLVAAAVTFRRSGVLALGIDVQPAGQLSGSVADLVGTGRELRSAPGLAARGLAASVLFSAKECVFKAWFPLTGSWLEFEDVDLRLRDDGSFRVERPLTPGQWRGRWQVSGGYVRAAAAITWSAF